MSLIALVSFGAISTNSFAEDSAATATVEAVTDAAVAVDAAAGTNTAPITTEVTATATPAAAATPVPDKGDTAWMIVATVLVTLMVVPGLGLFYGGLVRQKNMLSVLMQTFAIFSLMGVLWALYGYSVAFTAGNPFIGGFGKAFLATIKPESIAATFSKGVYIPELIFVAFQLTFADFNGNPVELEAPLPKDMRATLQQLAKRKKGR